MSHSERPPRGRVLIVEPCSSGLLLLAEAHRLGFEVVVATADRDDRYVPDEHRQYVHELLVVDTNDEVELTGAVTELHRRQPLVGIVPGFEFYVDVVARIAHWLDLPGLPARSATALRNKRVMREHAAAAGLRVPRYAELTGEAALAAVAARVGFPAVVKPVDAAGSTNVSRVDSPDELLAAHLRIREDLRTDLGRGPGGVLVEEYIGGDEVSVEGYVLDGEPVFLAVTTKMLGEEPHFVELGQVMPRDMGVTDRLAVEAYVTEVCAALGLTMGPFHCELRLPEGEPVLIEIAARLAGHRIPHLLELVTGTSQVRVMLAAYTGLRPEDLDAFGAPEAKYVGIACLTAPELDSYREVHGVEELRAREDVLELAISIPPGEEIPPAEDFRCFLGHVVFRAESYEQALTRWHGYRDEVRFV